jgi:hypothetical protein
MYLSIHKSLFPFFPPLFQFKTLSRLWEKGVKGERFFARTPSPLILRQVYPLECTIKKGKDGIQNILDIFNEL